MEEPLIVIFTECGKPLYAVAKGSVEAFVGMLSEAPQMALETLSHIANTEGSIILIQSLEDLSGLVCV